MTPASLARRAATAAAAAALAAPVLALPATAAPAPAAAPVTVVPLATVPPAAQRLPGDDGRRSFGVQPSGPKKVDPRPNLTYRDVKPGQVLYDHVAILNISNRPVTLSVYAADAYNTPDGAFDVLRAGQTSRDLGSWVKLRRTTATVPARSALITPIELRVPKNAEPGDHAAAIVASLRSRVRDRKGNVVDRDDRVGTRLYVRIAGPLHPRIELSRHEAGFHAGRIPLGRGRATVTYTIRNTGNVRLVGKQTIRVTNLIGGSARAQRVPDLPELLPGNEFSFSTPVEKVLPTFVDTAHVTIDPVSVSGNVDPAMAQATAKARFVAVPWLVVAVLLALAGIGVRWWWRRRRARRAAAPAAPVVPSPAASPATATPTGAALSVAIALALSLPGAPVLAGASAVLAPSAAHAATGGGSLTFIPGKGDPTTPMYAVTSGACPAEATNVVGLLYGKGLPAGGVVAVTNGTATQAAHEGSFGIPPTDTFFAIAEQAGLKRLEGPYRLVLRCIDNLDTHTYATFTGTVTFDAKGSAYTAPVPHKPPADGVPVGYLALVFPEYKAAVEADVKQAAQDQKDTEAARKAGLLPGGSPAPTADDGGSVPGFVRSPLGWFGAAVLVLAVLGAGGWAWTRMPRRAGAGAGGARVHWPDERR